MRIEQLNFTRFIAAVSIVIFHFGKAIPPFKSSIFAPFWDQPIGVSFFFMLSGFIMIIAYGSGKTLDTKRFFINRLARIYPSYLLGAVFMIVFKVTMAHEPILIKDLGLYFSLSQAWFSDYALVLNLPGWSLSVEVFFYAMFPLIFMLIKRLSFRQAITAILTFSLLSILVSNFLNSHDSLNQDNQLASFLLYFPALHLNEFLLGCMAGMIYVRHREQWQGNFDLAVIALMVALGFFLYAELVPTINYFNGFLGIFMIPLILLLALNSGWITKLFHAKPLVFLGEISYGIYIFHYPIFKIMYSFDWGNELLGFSLSLLCLLGVCTLSFYFFEMPLRNWIKGWVKRS